MASIWLNLVNNISEVIHKIKCKYGHDDKKYETCGGKCKYCDCFPEYTNFKDDLREYKRLCSDKNYQYKFDKKLKEQFSNTYKFFNHNNNKCVLLLRKGIYPYESMDDWEKFSETSLPEREDFYNHLNMEDNTDAVSVNSKRFCKDVEWKNVREYHDL